MYMNDETIGKEMNVNIIWDGMRNRWYGEWDVK